MFFGGGQGVRKLSNLGIQPMTTPGGDILEPESQSEMAPGRRMKYQLLSQIDNPPPSKKLLDEVEN